MASSRLAALCGLLGLAVGAAGRTVATGQDHTCVITAADDVACFGQIYGGGVHHEPAPVGLPGALDIDAGNDFTCARMQDTSVRCWGEGSRGQLGRGSFGGSATPAPVTGIEYGARDLCVGAQFACAKVWDGSVVCWGANSDHQVGHPTVGDVPLPNTVASLSDPDAIACGANAACALQGGSVLCWGAGYGAVPVIENSYASDTSGAQVIDISVGDANGPKCVTIQDGVGRQRVSCWGAGAPWTGHSSSEWNAPPASVTSVATGINNVCVSGGGSGSVQCWGHQEWNAAGQQLLGALGMQGTQTVMSPGVDGPWSEFGSGVHAVSLAHYHACAVLTDGQLVCWGMNNNGQCGLDEATDPAVPEPLLLDPGDYGVDGVALDVAPTLSGCDEPTGQAFSSAYPCVCDASLCIPGQRCFAGQNRCQGSCDVTDGSEPVSEACTCGSGDEAANCDPGDSCLASRSRCQICPPGFHLTSEGCQCPMYWANDNGVCKEVYPHQVDNLAAPQINVTRNLNNELTELKITLDPLPQDNFEGRHMRYAIDMKPPGAALSWTDACRDLWTYDTDEATLVTDYTGFSLTCSLAAENFAAIIERAGNVAVYVLTADGASGRVNEREERKWTIPLELTFDARTVANTAIALESVTTLRDYTYYLGGFQSLLWLFSHIDYAPEHELPLPYQFQVGELLHVKHRLKYPSPDLRLIARVCFLSTSLNPEDWLAIVHDFSDQIQRYPAPRSEARFGFVSRRCHDCILHVISQVLHVDEDGNIVNASNSSDGNPANGQAMDEDGNYIDEDGNIIGTPPITGPRGTIPPVRRLRESEVPRQLKGQRVLQGADGNYYSYQSMFVNIPGPPPAGPEVRLTLVVRGFDYNALTSKPSLRTQFVTQMQVNVARRLGHGLEPQDCAVRLAPGSVIAEIAVNCPEDADMASLQATISSPLFKSALERDVAEGTVVIPNIYAATHGPVTVHLSDARIPGLAAEETAAPASSTPLLLVLVAVMVLSVVLMFMCVSYLYCRVRRAQREAEEVRNLKVDEPDAERAAADLAADEHMEMTV